MRKLRSPVPIQRADEHLVEVSDVVALILKGHLLVEEALFAAIQTKFSHPQYFLDANPRFAQLLLIAKAFFFADKDSPVWDAIQALNTVRNRLAHTLEPVVSADDLKKICFTMAVPDDLSLDHKDVTFFINAGLGAILAHLWMIPTGVSHEARMRFILGKA